MGKERALARSSVAAVLLPACGLFLDLPPPPARLLVEEGAIVALASDFNPGSSFCESLPLVMNLGCTRLGLSPAETLNACTVNAAHVLGLNDVGRLATGCRADVLVLDTSDWRYLAYHLGGDRFAARIKSGRLQHLSYAPPTLLLHLTVSATDVSRLLYTTSMPAKVRIKPELITEHRLRIEMSGLEDEDIENTIRMKGWAWVRSREAWVYAGEPDFIYRQIREVIIGLPDIAFAGNAIEESIRSVDLKARSDEEREEGRKLLRRALEKTKQLSEAKEFFGD